MKEGRHIAYMTSFFRKIWFLHTLLILIFLCYYIKIDNVV